MTREEAIEILENTTFIAPLMVDVDTALDMAISALSAEPCDDCISRKDAIQALKADGLEELCRSLGVYPWNVIKMIPSVQPKKGEWIEWKGDNLEGVPICSHCKFGFPFLAKNYNFCPHCGADMRKPTKGD